MKVGFVGLGNLGREAAEVMQEYYDDIIGFDLKDIVTTIPTAKNLKECVQNRDLVFVAVPTAHDPDYDGMYPTSHLNPKDFDYSVAIEVTKDIDALVDKNTLIVMISTMLPGTVRREIQPLVKNGRFIYNPYLIAQGTVKWDMKNPEMLIIGTEDGHFTQDTELLTKFYAPMVENNARLEIGTWEEAESIKIFYNTFITTKLCLVNMIQDAAMSIGNMNVDIVTNALKYSSDRIMGPSYMKAGLGDGGGCHPRDNIALRSLAERCDFGYDLFDAIMVAREKQAENMAKFFEEIGVPKNMPCVVLGKGFKPHVDQENGSPSILVGYYLEKLGYKIQYDKITQSQPSAFLLGWPEYFNDKSYPKGSIIVDPWRLCSNKKGIKVYHYGDTRNHKFGLLN